MTHYSKAGDDTVRLLRNVTMQYHGGLEDAKVSMDVLMAWAEKDEHGDISKPALKVHGHPAYACIRITGLKERTCGRGDVEITIDGDKWGIIDEGTKASILDHELCHLELQTMSDGGVKRDDLDRPKLKLVHHDHQFGWFDAVVRRHGTSSIEAQQATLFLDGPHKQLWLPFMNTAPKQRTRRKAG